MELTDKDKTTYLANIISVARSDGQLTPSETDAISNIQKSIGAKKAILNKAEALAENSQFKPEPIGSLSDRIANLENLVYVSLIDGKLRESEKAKLMEFAKLVGVTKDQFQTIIREVKKLVFARKTLSARVVVPNYK